MPFPLAITDLVGHYGSYVVYLIIGFGFGAVLEMAGFGHSPKLAAQFYFKDQTVLKVMFTAIIVAMVGIFLTSGLGLLDYNLVWVNPTYLWPGILGGLIMGAGFIIGGFCPGTSLVAAATLKLDGIFFALGAFFGIFLFGETVEHYEDFWYSSYLGRYTVPEFLGIGTGVIVLGIVLMALMAFGWAEMMERIFGKENAKPVPKPIFAAAGVLVLLAGGTILTGQPSTADRWDAIKDEKQPLLDNREVQIAPAELLSLLHNHKVVVHMLDVRSEADYNLFHILDAEYVPSDQVVARVADMEYDAQNTVFVVMSNHERSATQSWKDLVAESVPNVYILEGGINRWIDAFGETQFKVQNFIPDTPEDKLRYRFSAALGSRQPMADPNPDVFEYLTFVAKVQLQNKRGATGGGCG